MNVYRIKEAADRISRHETALKWLKQYGVQLTGHDKDGFRLTFHTNFAGSCAGATEAKEIIDALARFEIESIVQSAIRNCQNTIVMDRDAIRKEIGKETNANG